MKLTQKSDKSLSTSVVRILRLKLATLALFLITVLFTQAVSTSADEILINGSFESDIAGWQCYVGHLSTTQEFVRDGQTAACLTSTGTADKIFFQDVVVQPDSSYTFNGWVKNPSITETTCLQVDFLSQSWETIRRDGSRELSGNSTDYQRLTITGTVPSQAVSARCQAVLKPASTDLAVAYFDALSFDSMLPITPTPIPTPSPVPTPTPDPTVTSTPDPTPTPIPTISPTPTTTPTASPTPSPTPIPTPTVTPTPVPSPSPSPIPTLTPTPSPSATSSPTPSPTPSPTSTTTPTRSPTPTKSPTPTRTPSPTPTPTPSPTATTIPFTSGQIGDVIINEVMYNPAEGGAEWVELYNRSGKTMALIGWTISDNYSTDPIPSISLPAGKIVVIAADQTAIPPDFSGLTVFIADGRLGNGLANTGDRIILRDGAGSLIDAMSYGNDTSILNPASPAISRGHSLERCSAIDTDQASDFVDNPQPSPGIGLDCENLKSNQTPSPTQTFTPSPTPALTYSLTPGPTLVSTPSPLPSATPKVTSDPSPTPDPPSTVSHGGDNDFWPMYVIIVLAGIILVLCILWLQKRSA